MAIELWTSGELYDVLTDDRLDAVPSYFLDAYFQTRYFSGDKEIQFSELPAKGRKLAPFVLPTEQGKPIFGTKGEKVKTFTPPYIKPKDAVRAVDARNIRPSDVFRNGGQIPDLQTRFDARVVEIQEFHKRAIRMQIAWMAARAFIDGKVTVRYERDSGSAFPEVTIDFGRDAGHTVVKLTGFWDDPNTDILADVQGWTDTMRVAKFGGQPNQMIVGSAVAGVFGKNTKLKDQMDTRYRGNDVNVKTGLINFSQYGLSRIGNLGADMEVWTYKDQVENDNGQLVDILDPKEILLIAPGAEGIEAYGAIYDAAAMESGQAASVDIFPKMFKTDDPGDLFIMNQSSPLPIPLYPNRTFKARVLA